MGGLETPSTMWKGREGARGVIEQKATRHEPGMAAQKKETRIKLSLERRGA